MDDLNHAIPQIMERFKFKKVHEVMSFLNWTWGHNVVPSEFTIRSTAHGLLRDCVAAWEKRGRPSTGMTFATGGFIAQVECFQDAPARLSLVFYVDHADSDGSH